MEWTHVVMIHLQHLTDVPLGIYEFDIELVIRAELDSLGFHIKTNDPHGAMHFLKDKLIGSQTFTREQWEKLDR